MPSPRWVVIAGPTAGGKSALALQIAERFGGEIVNADSRQVFRFMDIGTAKPTRADRDRLPHHVFDVVDPDEPFDAARYRALAEAAIVEIASRGKVPIVVGGTGLYLRVLLRGLFAGPTASAPLRLALESVEQGAPGSLHRWCRRLDPEVAARVHENDRVRLVRALEVALTTGERMSSHHRRHAFAERLGSSLYLIVDPGSAELKQRIRARSRTLFQQGLVEEVRSLQARGYGPELAALRSIGYLEAGRVLRGERTLDEAYDDLVRSTERFAKRQRTWFRAEKEAIWLPPETPREGLLEKVERFLAEN
jgi:tRNA dimethylallyltransferase